jgi:hypothetical protein
VEDDASIELAYRIVLRLGRLACVESPVEVGDGERELLTLREIDGALCSSAIAQVDAGFCHAQVYPARHRSELPPTSSTNSPSQPSPARAQGVHGILAARRVSHSLLSFLFLSFSLF